MNNKLSFSSDYMEGAHPEILRRLMETNLEKTISFPSSSSMERFLQKDDCWDYSSMCCFQMDSMRKSARPQTTMQQESGPHFGITGIKYISKLPLIRSLLSLRMIGCSICPKRQNSGSGKNMTKIIR